MGFGLSTNGDFDEVLEAMDAIDEELNQRDWDRYNREDHSNKNYGVHREHGWYLPMMIDDVGGDV